MTRLGGWLVAAALLMLLPGLACAQPVPNTFGVGVGMPDLGKLDANFAALSGTRTNYNTALTSDYALGGTPIRANLWSTTLTPSVTTTNVWENFYLSLGLSGPGTATGEINLVHPVFTINAGATSTSSEVFEASVVNSGTIGSHVNYLALPSNQATGTATTIFGYKSQLLNANVTAGAITTYAGVDCEAVNGGGSTPTNNYCIRNGDANSLIATNGKIKVGSLGGAAAQIDIIGADNAAGTLSFQIKNQATTVVLSINNAGGITVFGTPAVSCTSGTVVAATVVVTNGIVTHC